MKIELKSISIRELTENFKDLNEEGVFGYNNKLNIRPPFQREFVYDADQQKAVIETVNKGFPLNTMYWSKNQDGTFELLDGQQRTLSICDYVSGKFSIDNMFFYNLPQDKRDVILNYNIMVYVCEGSESEKLAWFRTINIAGEKLTDQELLNINYTGTWLSDAKLKFSKTNCAAYGLGEKYVKGSPIRQEFLETALNWISKGNVSDYMAKHQHDASAFELWNHYSSVIYWIQDVFRTYRREMKGIDWGSLYDTYHQNSYDPTDVEKKVKDLMENEEVTNKRGIFEYVLSDCSESKARALSKRTFSEREKRVAYERQNGICPLCHDHFDISEMEGDHITPWWLGGKTVQENCQMLCHKCNSEKSGRVIE